MQCRWYCGPFLFPSFFLSLFLSFSVALRPQRPYGLLVMSDEEPRALKRCLLQCCFTSTETVRTIMDGEPRTTTSTFTQLLSSEGSVQMQRCFTSARTIRLGENKQQQQQQQQQKQLSFCPLLLVSHNVKYCCIALSLAGHRLQHKNMLHTQPVSTITVLYKNASGCLSEWTKNKCCDEIYARHVSTATLITVNLS